MVSLPATNQFPGPAYSEVDSSVFREERATALLFSKVSMSLYQSPSCGSRISEDVVAVVFAAAPPAVSDFVIDRELHPEDGE